MSSKSNTAATSVYEDGLDPAQQLDELLSAWPESDDFSAHSFLRRHPALCAQRSAVVAVAVEDYLRQRKAAQTVDLHSFAAGFGDIEASVVRAAEVMEYFLHHVSADDAAAADNWPAVGDQVLHFTLLEELGGGLLSRVFIARDESVADRLVVVKLTRNSDREIRALGRLSHPGVTPILSVAQDIPRAMTVVVMPFLSRVTLFDIVSLHSEHEGPRTHGLPIDALDKVLAAHNARTPSPPRDQVRQPAQPETAYCEWVAQLGAALADALDAAHRQGILHCDIKPSNIVLVDRSRPMLVDFNLCLEDDVRRIAVGGTIPYMSQEQLCSLPLDARGDVFSLAATLYHVLTGVPPFGGPELALSQALSVRMAGQSRSAVQFHRLVELDPALAQVIIRALAFEPGDRFPSAAAFAEALRACCNRPARIQRLARRHRRLLIAAACASGLFLTALGIWQVNRAPFFVRATRAAIAAAGNDDFHDCIRWADAAIAANPGAAAAYVIRADARLRSGDPHQAYDDLKQAALRSSSTDVNALLSYVEYLLAKNDGDAIDSMHSALASGLSEAESRNNLGYCYFVREHFSQALAELDKSTSADPLLASGWLNLAAVDLRLAVKSNGRPATQYIDKAVELSPLSKDVRRIAAEVYIQDVNKGGDAIETMKKHCMAAVRLGVPVIELEASLKRLQTHLGSWSLSAAAKNSASSDQPTRTPRFVSPCDASHLAESLLETSFSDAR